MLAEGAARLADREEIMSNEAVRAWVFETVDALVESNRDIADFLRRTIPSPDPRA